MSEFGGRTGPDAVRERDAAASQMTPAQIAEAQRMASEWKPKLTVFGALVAALVLIGRRVYGSLGAQPGGRRGRGGFALAGRAGRGAGRRAFGQALVSSRRARESSNG